MKTVYGKIDNARTFKDYDNKEWVCADVAFTCPICGKKIDKLCQTGLHVDFAKGIQVICESTYDISHGWNPLNIKINTLAPEKVFEVHFRSSISILAQRF